MHPPSIRRIVYRVACAAKRCRKRVVSLPWPRGNATGCRFGPIPWFTFRPNHSKAVNAATSSANRAKCVHSRAGSHKSSIIRSIKTRLSYIIAPWPQSISFAQTARRRLSFGPHPFARWPCNAAHPNHYPLI